MPPKHASKRATACSPGGAPEPEPAEAAKKRRVVVSMACDRCRSRKSKCDGKRPICTPCTNQSQVCRYATEVSVTARRQETQALREEVLHLRRLLERAAAAAAAAGQEIVLDPELGARSSTCSSLQQRFLPESPSPIASPSYHDAVRATIPYTQSPLEFELMCKHPNAYHIIEPHGPSEAIANALLAFEESPFRPGTNSVSHVPALPQPIPLCDDRLRDLEIAYWTTVPVSNDTAAAIISLYLTGQHPVLGTFDADLFLADLVNHKLRFCSPLLVNAVLYFGCQAYTVFDAAAPRLAWLFYAEAKKLWDADKSTDSFLHVAALVNITYAGSSNGHDNEAMQFLGSLRKVARRLGLEDDAADDAPPSPTCPMSDDVRSRAHIAWGYFVVTCGYAFYYTYPAPKATPPLPIPGTPGFPMPSYMGSTFTSICKFWRLGREIVVLHAGAPESAADRVPLAAMESKYQQLLALAAEFPSEPQHGARIPHHAAVLQVWYHTAIITLMRPWCNKKVLLRTFDSSSASPESISTASLRQLKRLVVEIRLYYSEATHNIQWHPGLLFIANAVLANSERDHEWQFYFMACLYGYGVLSPAFRVAALCFKGLLALAVESGKMPASRARFLVQALTRYGERLREQEQQQQQQQQRQQRDGEEVTGGETEHIYSGIQLNLDVAASKEKAGTVEELAKRLETTVLAEEGKGDEEDEDVLFEDLINFE